MKGFFLRKIVVRLLGSSVNDFDISSRLLMQSHFGLMIITLCASFFNYYLELGINLSLIMLFAAAVYFIGYMLIYKKRKFFISFLIFLILSIFLINYLWIYNGGSNGGTYLVIYAFYTFLLFIRSNKYAPYIMALYIINISFLFYFEYNYPSLIVGYETDKQRYIDIMIVSYFIFLLGSPMLLFGKNLFVKAKEKAEDSEKSKMRFLANISHDIRTPLNAIIGFTDLLKSEGVSEKERKIYIQTIESNSEKLLYLVNNILNLSQIDSGVLKVNKSMFGINEFLENVFQTYSILMSNGKVKLQLKNELEESNIVVNSDQNLLYQVLTNLLTNSIKFTEKGAITFGVEKVDSLRFFVIDTGIGIPKNKQSLVFDRFRQVEKGSKDAIKGVGLGLAICYEIMALLGGEIELESDGKTGTTVYFTPDFRSGTPNFIQIKH